MRQTGRLVINLAGQATPSNGGAGSVANPELMTMVVKRVLLQVITPSAGAANLAVGTGAAGSANNNIIAAQAINGVAAGSTFSLLAYAAGAAAVQWTAAQVLNATVSAASAAFVGRLYVEYIRMEP